MNIIPYSIFKQNIRLYVFIFYSLAFCYCKSINLQCTDKYINQELYFQRFYLQNSLIFENEKESLQNIDDSQINILKLTSQIEFPEDYEIIQILFTQHQRMQYENYEYIKQQSLCVLIKKLDNIQFENNTKQYIVSCTYIDFDQKNKIQFKYSDKKNNYMSVYVNEKCTKFIKKQYLEFYLLCHIGKEIKIYLIDLKLSQSELIFYQEIQKDIHNCTSELVYSLEQGFFIVFYDCEDWFVQLLNENFDTQIFIDSTILNKDFPNKIFSHLKLFQVYQNSIYFIFQNGYIQLLLLQINQKVMQLYEMDNIKLLLFNKQNFDKIEVKEVENNLKIETPTQNLILGTIKAKLIQIDQIILVSENDFLTFYFSDSFYLNLQLQSIGNILLINQISNNLFFILNSQRQLNVYEIKKRNFFFKPQQLFFYEIQFWGFFSPANCNKIYIQNQYFNQNDSNNNILQLEILNQCQDKGFSNLNWKNMTKFQYPFYFLFDDQASEVNPLIKQQKFLEIDNNCNQKIIQNPQLSLLYYKFSQKYMMYNNDSILIIDFCDDSVLFEINIKDYIVLQQNNYLVLLSQNQTELQIINDFGSLKLQKIQFIHHPYQIQYFPEQILVYFKEINIPIIYQRHFDIYTQLKQDIYINQTILFYLKYESYQYIQYQDILIILFNNNLEQIQLHNCTIFEINKVSINIFQIFAVHNTENKLLLYLYIDQNLIELQQIPLFDFQIVNPFNYKLQYPNLAILTQKNGKLYIFTFKISRQDICLLYVTQTTKKQFYLSKYYISYYDFRNDFKTLNLQNIQFYYNLSYFTQTNLIERIDKNVTIISNFSKEIKQHYIIRIKIINLCYKLFKKVNKIIFEQYFSKEEQKFTFDFQPSKYFLNQINILEISENQDYILQGPFIMQNLLNLCEVNKIQGFCLKKQNINYSETEIQFYSIQGSNQFLGQIVVTNNYSIYQVNETSFFHIYFDKQFLHILYYQEKNKNNSLKLIQEWKIVDISDNKLFFLNSISIQQQRDIILLKYNTFIIYLFYNLQGILLKIFQDQHFLDFIYIEDSDDKYLVLQNYSEKIFQASIIQITYDIQVVHFTYQISKVEILEEDLNNQAYKASFSREVEINKQQLQFYQATLINEVLKIQSYQLTSILFRKIQFEIDTKNQNFSFKVLKQFRVHQNPNIVFQNENFIVLSDSSNQSYVYDIRDELDFHDYISQIENQYLIKQLNNTHQLFIKFSDPNEFYIGQIGFQFVFKNFQSNKILGNLIAKNDLSHVAMDIEFNFYIQTNENSSGKHNNHYYLILIIIFSLVLLFFSFFVRRRKMIIKFQNQIKDLENSNIQ